MSTLTIEQQEAIRQTVDHMVIPVGLGTKEAACTVAAINIALSGELTDDIPACMPLVIGRWIITIQDAMPSDMRNSRAWKDLIPFAAGTGRGAEDERRDLILDWMWGTVLPVVQPVADERGFGKQWRRMTSERTSASAAAASADAWETFDPCGLLARLIAVGEKGIQ